jgi:hypothetical protein
VVPQTVMNSTRTMFAKRSDGTIFPVLLNVKPLDHCFAGLISELHSGDDYLVFTSESLKVTAASRGSCSLLQV